MMSVTALQLVVAAFDDDAGAQAGLTALKQMKSKKQVDLQGAMLITKDAAGRKIKYKDVGLTPGKGALGGVVLGAAVGILTGGTGLILGAAGAALGGLVGKKKQDNRFEVNQLNQVGASLKPGGAAIVAVVEPEGTAEVEQALDALAVDIFTSDISDDLVQQLWAHKEKTQAILENKV